jgi:hypothetical protein
MASMTLAEAQTQLTQVNIAIDDLLQGKTIVEIKYGNSDFSRWFKYGEISLDNLRSYRRELLDLIDSLSPDPTPVFRTNACIPIVVLKGNM